MPSRRMTWLTTTALWSWSCCIIISQTVVLPDAAPPATPENNIKNHTFLLTFSDPYYIYLCSKQVISISHRLQKAVHVVVLFLQQRQQPYGLIELSLNETLRNGPLWMFLSHQQPTLKTYSYIKQNVTFYNQMKTPESNTKLSPFCYQL